ncbi:hypothetical protein WJX79_010876 [Trebouxia sp. C0005]
MGKRKRGVTPSPGHKRLRAPVAASVTAADLDFVACQVCNSTEDTNFLLCDGCNGGSHLACVGLESVPDGFWVCKECRNQPTVDSAMRQVLHAAGVSGLSQPDLFLNAKRLTASPYTHGELLQGLHRALFPADNGFDLDSIVVQDHDKFYLREQPKFPPDPESHSQVLNKPEVNAQQPKQNADPSDGQAEQQQQPEQQQLEQQRQQQRRQQQQQQQQQEDTSNAEMPDADEYLQPLSCEHANEFARFREAMSAVSIDSWSSKQQQHAMFAAVSQIAELSGHVAAFGMHLSSLQEAHAQQWVTKVSDRMQVLAKGTLQQAPMIMVFLQTYWELVLKQTRQS